jgi:hypothetical protein
MSEQSFNSYYLSIDQATEDGKCIKTFMDGKNNLSPESILFALERSFNVKLLYKENFYKADKKKEIIEKLIKTISRKGYIKKKQVEVKQITDELITNCQRHGIEDYLNTLYVASNSQTGLIATINKVDSEMDIERVKNKFLKYHLGISGDVGPINWDQSQGSNIGIDLIIRKATSFGLIISSGIVFTFHAFSLSTQNKQRECKNIVFGEVRTQ